ncbi:MAG: mandelate racemase/muconate lactonizing enzyme family protein [Anaerolineae bacterium]|nr:mandelate racemase/muconate lactonizing enzyme family protein [Anaerolineae bacterium]
MAERIDSIEIFHYRLPLEPPFHASWDPQPRTNFDSFVVRVRTNNYEGVGSGDLLVGLAENKSLFIGQDPFAIERHVHILDNLQFHYGRMWPLEVALWDLMGKITGQPLWRLLGGRANQVPLYASTGERRPIPERVESAKSLQSAGFPAMKLRFHADNPGDDVAVVQAVREAVGPDMEILVDANQGWQMPWDASAPWDFKTALWVADALAELDVYWLEEPLPRHDYRGMAELRRRARVRIAGGEGNRAYAEFRECLYHGSLDVYQADVVWSTGVLRARRLAAEVQAAGAMYSPHTWGDGLVLLTNLQVAAAVSQAPFIEFPYDPLSWTPERRDFILPSPLHPTEPGRLTLPDGPGLGVELDWEILEQFRVTS